MNMFCCVFSPHVFPVTQFFLHVDCLIWSQVCLLSSLVNLSLKAPVLSVSVLSVLKRHPWCSCVSHVLLWIIKDSCLWIPRLLIPCFRAPCVSWQKDRLTTVTSAFSLCFVYRFLPSVFLSVMCPMDPLLRPEFLLLLLEQGERSLEDHTRLFLALAELTSYPDDALCSLYDASLNTACRVLSSEDGPRAEFAAFVEWILARNGSPLTVSQEDDLARSTPDPEPSPPSPRGAEHQPEPTDDGEPFPAAICEPARSRATERMIATEVEPNPSDQVREPATMPTTREPAVDGVSAEWSSAPCTVAEGELIVHLGLLDVEGDLIDWSAELEIELPPLLSPSSPLVPASSAPPERSPVPIPRKHSPECPPVPAPPKCPPVPAPRKFPPSHPLLPPPLLSSGSPSAHPQPSINAVRAPRDCHPPASPGLEFPSSPPPASEARTPSRSVDPVAPPRLLAPSPPPSPIDPPAPPGSLVPPAPPWSGVDPPSPQDSSPLAAPRRSVPPAPLGSFLPSAPPGSSVAPALPRISGAPPEPPEPSAPPWPPRSSASPWLVGSPSRAPPPPAPPPLVGPLESAAITPPWLLPPSAPPWAIMAVAWVQLCASCSGSLLSLPWLLPPLSPPWSLSAGPLPDVRPPPDPPPNFPPAPPLWMFQRCEDAPSGRGAICQDPGLFCCGFSPHVFPVTQFFLHVDCLIWSQVCLLSSLVNLSLKAPVLSVSVLSVLKRHPWCSCVSHVLLWIIKDSCLWIPRLLVPCFRAPCVSWQ